MAREVDTAIERELLRRPDFSHRVLQEVAANLDPAIRHMDPRRFHAEYVVPAQRRIRESTGRKKKRAKRPRTSVPTLRPVTAVPTVQQPSDSEAPERATPVISPSPAEPPEPQRTARRKPQRRARREPQLPTEPAVPASAVVETVRREQAPARRTPRTATRAARMEARTVFFEWARALADAESTIEVVAVLTDVDRFVDRLLAIEDA